jgi:peptide deformylase
MILPIVVYGDAILQKEADDVELNKSELQLLVDNMFETMYNAKGVGLAAPQIGKSLRLFIVDSGKWDEEKGESGGFKEVFINPEIIEFSEDVSKFEEGCLSIPHIRETVIRPNKILINWLDIDGTEHEQWFDGINSRIIQHEYDHIEGVLFTDRISALKKTLLKSKLSALSKGLVTADYPLKTNKK